jgi:hypothetical protein
VFYRPSAIIARREAGGRHGRASVGRLPSPSRFPNFVPDAEDRALVRAGHRTPFTVPTDLGAVDVPKLTATLTRDATAITGPGQIRSVVVTSQAPRRRARVPHA